VIQLGPLGSVSGAMFEVVEISDACFVYLFVQYAPHAVVSGFKSDKFGGHSRQNEPWHFSFQKLYNSTSILIMSTYVIITLCCASSDGIFYVFSVTLKCQDELCQKFTKIC